MVLSSFIWPRFLVYVWEGGAAAVQAGVGGLVVAALS
jgi:hypothetical protein